MALIIKPISRVMRVVEDIIDSSPLLTSYKGFMNKLARSPLYVILFGCYAVTLMTPVLFYCLMGFLVYFGLVLMGISFAGCIFGGISIIFLASLAMLFSGFLFVGSNISVGYYFLQKLGIIHF